MDDSRVFDFTSMVPGCASAAMIGFLQRAGRKRGPAMRSVSCDYPGRHRPANPRKPDPTGARAKPHLTTRGPLHLSPGARPPVCTGPGHTDAERISRIYNYGARTLNVTTTLSTPSRVTTICYYHPPGNIRPRNRIVAPNSVIAESSNAPGSLEARVNASIRQEMGTKLNQGLIHLPTPAQAAELAKLQAGLGTFSNAELAKVAGELKGRVFFIDDSLNVPETAKNPKTTFGYTYPDLYPKTIFLNPSLFNDTFRLPDASGQKAWIYSVGETTIHENLHLRYGEQGINDPGGAKAHAIMQQYQDRIFNAIMKEAYGGP